MELSCVSAILGCLFISMLNSEHSSSFVSGVEIRELSVPEAVAYGSAEADAVILDCNYDFGEAERDQLEIKWYYNDEPRHFIQWIPSSSPKRGLQLIGERFLPHLDLNYSLETEEAAYEHRAIRLLNLTPKLSGSYKCKVASLTDEDSMLRKMMVYSAPEEVDFEVTEVVENATSESSNEVSLACSVFEVFPEPEVNVTVTWKNGNGSQSLSLDTSELAISENANDSNLFDARLDLVLDLNDLEGGFEEEVTFSCVFTLPEVDMTSEKVVALRFEPEEEVLGEEEVEEEAIESVSGQESQSSPSGTMSIQVHTCPQILAFFVIILFSRNAI